MPARVEFRLGSIFDEPCDLLVIPASAGGTVRPEIQIEIRDAGLPSPVALRDGVALILLPSHTRWRAVAYAGVVSEQALTLGTVEEIARKLGQLARQAGFKTVAAPLLGTGSGDLAPDDAAEALMRGFMSIAPEGTLMVISIRNPDRLEALAQLLPNAVGEHIRRPYAASVDPPTVATESWLARREREAVVEASRTPSVLAPVASSARQGVFISYSHADRIWVDRLHKHLKPLQRNGVEVWDDTRLKAGEQWREEIRETLATTKVAILLISADFLASDFIVTNELPPLLKAAEEDGATILPVIVSASRFLRIESLARFQAVNDPAKPLVQMSHGNREMVFDQVACAVEDALNR